MKSLIAVLTIITLAASVSTAQRTTRSRLKPGHPAPVEVCYDTIAWPAGSPAFTFSGYDKYLRSSTESFFATNHTDSTVNRVCIEIIYKDMKGRTLDTRTVDIDKDFAPGETHRIDIKSWDTQKAFYYHRSPTPRTSNATPYKVNISATATLRRR